MPWSLVIGDDGGEVRLLGFDAGRRRSRLILKQRTATIGVSVIEIQETTVIVAAAHDGSIARWSETSDAVYGAQVFVAGPVTSEEACLGPPGPRILIGTAVGQLLVCDAVTFEVVAVRKLTSGGIHALLSGNADDSSLVVAGHDDGSITIWDIDHMNVAGPPILAHPRAVRGLAWVPWRDRHILASASDDGSIRLWDLQNRQAWGRPLVGHQGPVRALTSINTPHGPIIASGGNDRTVRFWHPGSQAVEPYPALEHASGVRAVLLGVRGKLFEVYSGGDDGVLVATTLRMTSTPRETLAANDLSRMERMCDAPVRAIQRLGTQRLAVLTTRSVSFLDPP